MHRKAAIRLLRRAPRPPTGRSRPGRPPCYGPEVAGAAAVLWQAAAASARIASTPSCRNCSSASPGTGNSRSPRRWTNSCGRPVAPPSPACSRPPARSTRGAGRPSRGPGRGSSTNPHSHLHRVGRCPARVPRDRLGGPLRQQHPGLLPLHPLHRRYRLVLGRAASRLGQGPGPRGRGHPSGQRAPARAPRRPGQRQRLRVHQPAPLYLLPAARHHVYPQSCLEEKR